MMPLTVNFYLRSPGKQGCYSALVNPWLVNPNELNRPDFPPFYSKVEFYSKWFP